MLPENKTPPIVEVENNESENSEVNYSKQFKHPRILDPFHLFNKFDMLPSSYIKDTHTNNNTNSRFNSYTQSNNPTPTDLNGSLGIKLDSIQPTERDYSNNTERFHYIKPNDESYYNPDKHYLSHASKYTIGVDENGRLVYGDPITIQGLSSERQQRCEYYQNEDVYSKSLNNRFKENRELSPVIERGSAEVRGSSIDRVSRKKDISDSIVDKSEEADKIDYANFNTMNENEVKINSKDSSQYRDRPFRQIPDEYLHILNKLIKHNEILIQELTQKIYQENNSP